MTIRRFRVVRLVVRATTMMVKTTVLYVSLSSVSFESASRVDLPRARHRVTGYARRDSYVVLSSMYTYPEPGFCADGSPQRRIVVHVFAEVIQIQRFAGRRAVFVDGAASVRRAVDVDAGPGGSRRGLLRVVHGDAPAHVGDVFRKEKKKPNADGLESRGRSGISGGG